MAMSSAPAKSLAPTTEIGYIQPQNYNWWLYENESTPELVWPQSVYVYDQMRRTDSQVGSILRAVNLLVLRTPWRIDPNGARDEVVQWVADDFGLPIVGEQPKTQPRTKDRFSWKDHLAEALLMLPLGHSYFEQVYRPTDDGSRVHLRKLALRPAKSIQRIDVAPDGGLISITQYWTRTDSEPKPIPVNRLVAYIHAKEGGNWLGTSILRNCYKNWLLKDRLLRVQAQTIERNGMGVPLYIGAENETPDAHAAGLAMAKAWRSGEAAGSAIPFGAILKLVGVEGTLPDAEPAVRYHDESIAKTVLAHFLNLGQQMGTGSYALGATLGDFFTLGVQTVAQQLSEVANMHAVEDLVDANWGPDEPAPKIVFDEIGSRQAATAAAIKTLVDAGVIRPDDVLEESSRQQYGLPPANPDTVRQPPGGGGGADMGSSAVQDMFGAQSVAASAGESGPKGLAADAAEDDDDPADLESWALATAFAQLTGLVMAADWNPNEHLRGQHGRFRDMVTRVAVELVKWRDGGFNGDPLGHEFNREQLRKAALKVGFTPKRGASFDDLKKMFYDHARTRPGSGHHDVTDALDKPDVPAKKAAPKKAAPKKVPKAKPEPAAAHPIVADLHAQDTYNLRSIASHLGIDWRVEIKRANYTDVATGEALPGGYRFMTKPELLKAINKSVAGDPSAVDRIKEKLASLPAPVAPKVTKPRGAGAVSQGKHDIEALPARLGAGGAQQIRWREGTDPGWDNARSVRAAKALRTYGHHSFEVNNLLRGTLENATRRDLQDIIDGLDDITNASKTDAPMTVWRGLQNVTPMLGDRANGDLTGFEWQEKGFGSTSARQEISQYFATTGGDGMLMRVTVPAGIGAAQVKDRRSEAEALLQRGLRWRIVADHGVQPGWGYRLVDVEVIPDEAA